MTPETLPRGPARVFARIGRLVIHYPRTVLLAVLLASLGFALAIPNLQIDPSPRALLASADPERELAEVRSRALFDSTDNIMIVLVEAPDVLRQDVLTLVHGLSNDLASAPAVKRVDSLTTIPWPKPASDELSLDDLGDTPDPGASSDMLGAVADLVASAPDAFPDGLASLASQGSGELAPLVSGADVTEQDVQRVREAVERAPQLKGRLISADGRYLLVVVTFEDNLTKHKDLQAAVEGVSKRALARTLPDSVHVSLGGLPVVRTRLVDQIRKDQRILIPCTLLACLLVLVLSFRWVPAVALPLLTVAITALWLLGGMAVWGEPLNVLNNILPALVIIIGLNESVHFIGRYAEEYQRDSDRKQALVRTFRAMGPACLMTTLTSAIGMAALLVSRTEMLQRFGLVGACGLLLAYVVTILLVPAALSLLSLPPRQTQRRQDRGTLAAIIARVCTTALRSPWWVLAGTLLISAGAGYASTKVVVDSALLDQFPKTDPVYVSTQVLEKKFEGVRPLELVLTSPKAGRFLEPALLAKVSSIAKWAAAQRGVLRVYAPAEPLSQVWSALSGRKLDTNDALRSSTQVDALVRILYERQPRLLSPLMTRDAKSVRVRIRLADIGSKATGQFVERLEKKVASALGAYKDVKLEVGGDAQVSSRGLEAVVTDLSGSVTVAALLIFALLATLLGDPRLAALAVPPNLVPQVWTMAWMAMRGIPLNASTAIIFSLSIGLAVDGGIHLLSRFQEERARGMLVSLSIIRAVRGAGRSIVVSSLALILGFSTMFLSNFVPVQRFAELVVVSMTGCLVATLVLQPVLLHLFAARKRA